MSKRVRTEKYLLSDPGRA